jgi:spore coat polysaccharide biosynthesis protein SpsF
VVRVTADCPLIDPALVDDAIDAFVAGDCDYVSNMIQPTWPYGMAVEVLSRDVLLQADAEATDPAEREHVTPFVYWRPERFRLRSLTRNPDLSAHRWTVDTPQDLELVSRILHTLYPLRPEFTLDDVLDLLREHPAWEDINRHVRQTSVAPSSERA